MWCASREINYLETAGTTGTTEKFIIILMILCFAVVSFVYVVYVVYVVSKKNFPKPHNPISCQKGSDLALTRKLADGTYYAYFPFASLTEESKMTPYHKKLKEVFSKTTLTRLFIDRWEVVSSLLHNINYAVE